MSKPLPLSRLTRLALAVLLGAGGALVAPGPASGSGASADVSVGFMPGTPLPIPAEATVLTLNGANCNLVNEMAEKFQGVFSQAPYVMEQVWYPACFDPFSINVGVANLDSALRSTPGPKIVLAQSMGAQVASRWMRANAADPTAPPAEEVTFILTGNGLRAAGGYIIGRPEMDWRTGEPTPTDGPWTVIDVARRYDGWADWVHDDSNTLAVDNADRGKNSLHTSYDEVDITDPTHTIWTEGSTWFVLTQEDLPLRDLSTYAALPDDAYSQLRAHVESAYDRPPEDPAVVTQPVASPHWRSVLEGWGVTLRGDRHPVETASTHVIPVDPGGQAFYKAGAFSTGTPFTVQNWQTQLGNSATTGASCLGDGGPSGTQRNQSPRSRVQVTGPDGSEVLVASSPQRDPLTGELVAPAPGPYAYLGGAWEATLDLTGRPAGVYTVTVTSIDRNRVGTLLVSCSSTTERVEVTDFEYRP